MKIKKKINSQDAKNKGDYYFSGGNLILNCPFCNKKSYYGPLNVIINNSKITIKGLDNWIICCEYFKVENDKVIKM